MLGISPLISGFNMSLSKHPAQAPQANTSTADEAKDTELDAESTSAKSLLKKALLAKQDRQSRFPNPQANYKVTKIGNAPRGTRRSMGKR